MTLRVLHAHSGNLYGGVETVLVTMARHTARTPAVSWRFALGWEGRLSRELAAAGSAPAVVGSVRASRPWTVWAARSQLARLLRRDPADIAIVHSLWALAMFGPMLRRRVPRLVLAIHGPATGPRWLVALARRVVPDFVIANSRYMSRHPSLRLFAGVPTAQLYYPIDPSGAGALAGSLPDTGSGGRPILCASRLEPWKGHAVLIEALASLRQRPDWSCWIAGGPQRAAERRYLAALRALVARHDLADRVHFLGQRSDVPALLERASIHCQPNTGPEPFGIAFVEALYAGVPVVTSDCGAAPEIITPACGVLTPPGDVARLAAALASLLDDPARLGAMRAAAPARARELCDPAVRLPELAALLERVARHP